MKGGGKRPLNLQLIKCRVTCSSIIIYRLHRPPSTTAPSNLLTCTSREWLTLWCTGAQIFKEIYHTTTVCILLLKQRICKPGYQNNRAVLSLPRQIYHKHILLVLLNPYKSSGIQKCIFFISSDP